MYGALVTPMLQAWGTNYGAYINYGELSSFSVSPPSLTLRAIAEQSIQPSPRIKPATSTGALSTIVSQA